MKKACGLDVHKDSIFCAIYDGESYFEVKEFSTMTPDIYLMGEYLQFEGIEQWIATLKEEEQREREIERGTHRKYQRTPSSGVVVGETGI